MAVQQALFAEVIAGMKKAMARGDDTSDSDDTIAQPTNRANKLKRKAKYVHEGTLNFTDGPAVYKRQRIEHAGYHRYIVHRNPPKFDEDGDVIEEDSDNDEEDYAEALTVEENPFSDVKLETLLAPLTSAADLPTHPSLSTPYLSNHITELTNVCREFLHKEEAQLWRVKAILTKFRGDDTWVPVGAFETPFDQAVLNHRATIDVVQAGQVLSRWDSGANSANERSPEGSRTPPPTLRPIGPFRTATVGQSSEREDKAMHNASVATEQPRHAGVHVETTENDANDGRGSARSMDKANDQEPADQDTRMAETVEDANGAHPESPRGTRYPNDEGDLPLPPEEDDTNSQRTSHRMTTRAQANAISKTPSPPLSIGSDVPPIHPLYMFPLSARPDRDFGLPTEQADEIRRYLIAYVQKQEEIVRGLQELHESLMRVERMRKTVLRWCKAEGHVGEMSDGEDWYDKEEWGLEEDLVKGREEEEDEANLPGKKTRKTRRDDR